MGEGEAALRSWAEGGREGPWRWLRLRPGTVTVEQWEAMVHDMRGRQQQHTLDLKAERERVRQEDLKRREEERWEKAAEQAERAAARLLASANRKRQPRMGREEGSGRSGDFELTWRRGKGAWVRTGKRPGPLTGY